MNLEENAGAFEIQFKSKKHSVEAELYTQTINNAILLAEASANAVQPNCFSRLEIKAQKAGSFEVVLEIITNIVPDLFNDAIEVIRTIDDVVAGVVLLLGIKKYLGGKKAKKMSKQGEKTKIVNQNNDVKLVDSRMADSFFKNAHVDNSIINIFKGLKKGDVTGFVVKHGDQRVEFDQQEYANMRAKVVDEEDNLLKSEKKIELKTERLLIKKPDLLGKSVWQFVRYNKTISAKVEDNGFLNQVSTSKIKTFYAGVSIDCLLQVEYELDAQGNRIPDSDKYIVKKVIGDIIKPAAEAIDMFNMKD